MIAVVGLMMGSLLVHPRVAPADPAIDGSWTPLELSPDLPSGDGGTLLLDTNRYRLLYVHSNSVRALDLNDPVGWQPVMTTGATPPGRAAPFVVYDPQSDALVLWGGEVNNTYPANLYRLLFADPPDASLWQLVIPTGPGPPPRAWGGAVLNPTTRHMAIAGGIAGCTNFGDLWELSLNGTWQWTLLSSNGPGGYDIVLDYDETTGRYWRYGIWPCTFQLPIRWINHLSSIPADLSAGWSTLIRGTEWFNQAAVLDPIRRRLVTVASQNYGIIGGDLQPAVIALDTGAYTVVAPEGPAPNYYFGARGIVRDPVGDRIFFVHPGATLSSPLRTWVWTWSGTSGAGELPERPPSAGLELTADRNPVRVVFRGAIVASSPGFLEIDVLDAAGRHVRRLWERPVPGGRSAIEWDLANAAGRRVPAGTYFVVATGGGSTARIKLTVVD